MPNKISNNFLISPIIKFVCHYLNYLKKYLFLQLTWMEI